MHIAIGDRVRFVMNGFPWHLPCSAHKSEPDKCVYGGLEGTASTGDEHGLIFVNWDNNSDHGMVATDYVAPALTIREEFHDIPDLIQAQGGHT